jgi:ABC-type glycerol-3-phosphate transport system substrate-binding protein
MLQMAAKLTTQDASGNITRLGFQLPNWFWPQMGWMAAYGGPVWDKQKNEPTPDHPGVIKSLQALTNIAKSYGVDKMDAWLASIGSQTGAQMPYMSGALSMYIDGNYADQYPAELAPDWVFGKDYGSVPIPFAPKEQQAGNPTVALWAYPLSISAAGKNHRWAFELIRFIQSREYIVPMNVESRDLPAVTAYIKDPRFTNGSAQVTRFIIDNNVPTAAALPMHPAVGEYANKLGTAVDDIVHLKQTPEQAMADLKTEIQKVMSEVR